MNFFKRLWMAYKLVKAADKVEADRTNGRVFLHVLGTSDSGTGGGFWELADDGFRIPDELLPASPKFVAAAKAQAGTPRGYVLPPGWAAGRYITWDPDGFMLDVTDRVLVDREAGLACCPAELRERYEKL